MRARPSAKLVLGSVQLGLAYGAANRMGKPDERAALALVRRAVEGGVSAIDTARAYGDSEARLGRALGPRRVRTITKLSPLPGLSPDASPGAVRAAVDASIAASLAALGRERIDCLLLHRAAHLTEFGGEVWNRLLERLEDGTVLALGVSVQSPAEAHLALDYRDVVHLQLPFNLLDWRWHEAGVVARLAERPNVTVHVRSVFLQGLLVADPALWPRIPGVDAAAIVAALRELAAELARQGPADLCVAYVRGQDWVDGLVIGMETEDQVDANLALFLRPPLGEEDCRAVRAALPRVPEILLDPARWPARP